LEAVPAFEPKRRYFRHAEHCRRLAEAASDPADRQTWLMLATGYELLAGAPAKEN
jgi:hypothetical protein